MLHCIFGEKQAGASYRTRPGAYLIAVSGAQIASIRTPKGFFLPGGGVEPGETHEACILRECLEETGFLVQVGELLGSAESYLMHEKIGAFHPVQHYYAGRLFGIRLRSGGIRPYAGMAALRKSRRADERRAAGLGCP